MRSDVGESFPVPAQLSPNGRQAIVKVISRQARHDQRGGNNVCRDFGVAVSKEKVFGHRVIQTSVIQHSVRKHETPKQGPKEFDRIDKWP